MRHKISTISDTKARISEALSELDNHASNYRTNIEVTRQRFQCTEAEAKQFLDESKSEILKRLDALIAKYRSL